MARTLGHDQVVKMLRGAAEQIRRNHAMLSQYDSCGGDGDHGTTMMRAMGNMEKAIAGAKTRDIKGLLKDVGWAIMGTDGGATGPLFGTFFMSMSGASKESLDAGSLAAMAEAGLAGVQKQTKARVGDKTMLDALVPAVEAMRRAADGGADVATALERAAEAAEQGARATRNLQARFGRAKNVGEKSIGTQDPGATSVALIFKGFYEGVKERTDDKTE